MALFLNDYRKFADDLIASRGAYTPVERGHKKKAQAQQMQAEVANAWY
jgi:hypothetical protein